MEHDDPNSTRKSLGTRLATRWEALSPPRQAGISYPTIVVVLLVLHLSFFHRLSVMRCVGYAVFEGIVFTGLLLAATASERARKARLAAGLDPSADDSTV